MNMPTQLKKKKNWQKTGGFVVHFIKFVFHWFYKFLEKLSILQLYIVNHIRSKGWCSAVDTVFALDCDSRAFESRSRFDRCLLTWTPYRPCEILIGFGGADRSTYWIWFRETLTSCCSSGSHLGGERDCAMNFSLSPATHTRPSSVWN